MKMRTGLLAIGLAGSLLACSSDGSPGSESLSTDASVETTTTIQSDQIEAPTPYTNEVYITSDRRAAELRIINSFGQISDTLFVRCLGDQAIVKNYRSDDLVTLDQFSGICGDGVLTRAELGTLG